MREPVDRDKRTARASGQAHGVSLLLCARAAMLPAEVVGEGPTRVLIAAAGALHLSGIRCHALRTGTLCARAISSDGPSLSLALGSGAAISSFLRLLLAVFVIVIKCFCALWRPRRVVHFGVEGDCGCGVGGLG